MAKLSQRLFHSLGRSAQGQDLDPVDIKVETESIDWDADVVMNDRDIYTSLVRSIELTEGFSLLFVRCVEKDRAKLQQRLKAELPKLRFERLELTEELPDGNLYQRIEAVTHESG